jgi:hypothetical protein
MYVSVIVEFGASIVMFSDSYMIFWLFLAMIVLVKFPTPIFTVVPTAGPNGSVIVWPAAVTVQYSPATKVLLDAVVVIELVL